MRSAISKSHAQELSLLFHLPT